MEALIEEITRKPVRRKQAGHKGRPTVNHNRFFEIEDAKSAKFVRDNSELRGDDLPEIIRKSAAVQRVIRLVRFVAPTEATVLIQVETGTGTS